MTTKAQQKPPSSEQLHLWPSLDAPRHAQATPPGARRASPRPPVPGGGYLDCCTGAGGGLRAPRTARRRAAFDRDPRLAELRAMGLGAAWLPVAERIGYEAFVAMWEVLAAQDQVMDDRYRVSVPRFSTYLRYQRNQLCRTLAEAGRTPGEIRDAIRTQLGEELGLSHIVRILRSLRMA